MIVISILINAVRMDCEDLSEHSTGPSRQPQQAEKERVARNKLLRPFGRQAHSDLQLH